MSNELLVRVLLSLATEPGDPVGGKLIRMLGAVETVRRTLRMTADDGHGPEERWLQRDRILVALVVVEAARDSECMDTAYWANDVAVPVGVIPAIPDLSWTSLVPHAT